MRAGTTAGIPHSSYYIALIDEIALTHIKGVQMGVEGLKAVVVTHYDEATVVSNLRLHVDDPTAPGGADRCTRDVG